MFLEIVLNHPSFTFQEPITGKICFETNTASSPRSFQITLRVKGYAVYHHGFLSSPSSHKHPTVASSPSDNDETTEIFSHSVPVSIPAGPSAKSHAVDFQFLFPSKSAGSLPCSKSNDSMVNIRYMLKATIQKRYAFLSSSQSNGSSTFRRPSYNPQLPFAHLAANHASQYSTSSTSSSSSTSTPLPLSTTAPPSSTAAQPPFLSIAPTAPMTSFFNERYATSVPSPSSPPAHYPPYYYHPQNPSSLVSNPSISPTLDLAAHSTYSSSRPSAFPPATPPPHVGASVPYPYESPPSATPTASSFYSYSNTPPMLNKTAQRSYTCPNTSYPVRHLAYPNAPPTFFSNSMSSSSKDLPPVSPSLPQSQMYSAVSPSDPVPIAGQPNAFTTLAPGEKLSIQLEEDELVGDASEHSLLPDQDPMPDNSEAVFPPRKNSTIFEMDEHFVQDHTSSPSSAGSQRTSVHSLSPEVCLASDCTVSPSPTLSKKGGIDFSSAEDTRELNMDYAKEFDVLINQVLQSL
ncbi:meiotic suppressor protein Ste7 [Schizosaccharomyces cryophilus OY26]|uniref:Meiotic suppressor protein Ste7 n=1 Tax=Schizosaccharomyces cryophilus (strain OY26 / ATCC MYA-4695 / CBS 11777 / NBRC 106824 / NRRL Y48691) TaxID=653667 RepID=S9X7C0_SCHCR|nr:meiotic suppressor protein Ste7 [Schizosaccharomyces cryophilus OY26]EPY49671.1 meiotic suppressor protein Ste7 [Schizosaccharomyces cryophilus OY26]